VSRSKDAKLMLLAALTGVLLAGCGANAYPQYDQYGNPISASSAYGGSTYGSSTYGSSAGSYDNSSSSYGSYSTGSSSTYDTSASSYGSYGSSSGSYGSSSGTYGSYGNSTGTYGSTYPTAATSSLGGAQAGSIVTSGVVAMPSETQPMVLSTFVKDIKQTGLLGLSGMIAHVEITNPTTRTLGGKLHVVFTNDGHPSGNAQTRVVSLRPLETQVLTFTAKAFHLNDAEATVDTYIPAGTESTVIDLGK
jgi:hypothetical protein